MILELDSQAFRLKKHVCLTPDVSNYKLILVPYAQIEPKDITKDPLRIILRENGKQIFVYSPYLTFNWFTAPFFPSSEEVRKNILLFGVAGSGKSAFINSCYNMLASSKELVGNIVSSGSVNGHNTTKLKYARLADITTKELSPFVLVDTWGVDSSNYSQAKFNDLLKGNLPQDYQMSSTYKFTSNTSTPEPQNRKIHCAIFFVTIGDLNANSKYLGYVKEYAEYASRNSVSPLYCITKVDEDEAYANCRNSFPNFAPLLAKAAVTFNTQENHIFPLVNYKSETGKSKYVECYVYDLLVKACRCASTNPDFLPELFADF